VARAFEADAGAVRVVFRLEVVDEAGRATGATVPSAGVPPAARRRPRRGAGVSGRPGVALPLDDDPTGADSWLHPVTPLLGRVVALGQVGASMGRVGGRRLVRAAV